MDLFEKLMSETRSNEPQIVSEQHDPSQIDWQAGAMDVHELKGQRGVAAGLARAALDTSNGRVNVMVAGIPAWHKLGVNIAEAVSSHHARTLAGLDFTVAKEAMAYRGKDLQWEESDDTFSLIRTDTRKKLGTVGARYRPIQNDEGFAFMDDLLKQFGARYRTAGSLFGGEKVWMLADLPGCSFKVGRGDETICYAIFTNPHDGSGKAWVYPTAERVVCNNTLRRSLKDHDKGLGIRHTGDVKDKLADASDALAQSVEGFKSLAQEAAALARVRVPSMSAYVNAVLDQILPVDAQGVKMGAEALAKSRLKHDVSPDEFEDCVKRCEKQIQSRSDQWTDIIERFDSERCKVNGIEGTAWAAVQAVTEHVDYGTKRKKIGTWEEQMSRRFMDSLTGDGDEVKQVAYEMALEYTR